MLSESVHAVGQIGAVGGGRDDKDDDQYIDYDLKQFLGLAAAEGQPGVVKLVVLYERYGGQGADGILVYTYGDAYGQSQDNLSYNLVFAGHPLLVFPEDLDIIVRKAETAQPYQSDKQQLNVHVGQISEQQYCYENGAQDEYASHRGSAFLGQLSFQTQVPDLLSELLSLHVFYELLSETENQHNRSDARQDGAH